MSKHLNLVFFFKKNISENWMIDWTLLSLADPPLGFVLNVKILLLKWHNGGEGAQGDGNWRNSQKPNSSRATWPWKRRWWKKGPKFKHFLFVLFWVHCHCMASAQEGVDLTSTLSGWQCQEVCLTVCKYLYVSTLPLAAQGAALLLMALSLEWL